MASHLIILLCYLFLLKYHNTAIYNCQDKISTLSTRVLTKNHVLQLSEGISDFINIYRTPIIDFSRLSCYNKNPMLCSFKITLTCSSHSCSRVLSRVNTLIAVPVIIRSSPLSNIILKNKPPTFSMANLSPSR